VRFFDLIGLISLRSMLAVIVTAFVWVLALVWVFLAAAFGIFTRCQVTDFDLDLLGLLLLRHFIFLSYWVVLCCASEPFAHGYPAERGSGGALW